jgi:hypothetical protein
MFFNRVIQLIVFKGQKFMLEGFFDANWLKQLKIFCASDAI